MTSKLLIRVTQLYMGVSKKDGEKMHNVKNKDKIAKGCL